MIRRATLISALLFSTAALGQTSNPGAGLQPGVSGGPSYGANSFSGPQAIAGSSSGLLSAGNGSSTIFNVDTITNTVSADKILLASGPSTNLNVSSGTLPSAALSWLYESDLAFGKTTAAGPALHWFSTTDQVVATGPFLDNWSFNTTIGNTFWGNANTVDAKMEIKPIGTMTTLGNQAALFGRGIADAGTYGNGYGGLNTPGAYSQNLWAANSLLIIPSGAKGLQGNWGMELDFDGQAGATVGVRTGFQATILPDTAGIQGIYKDQAFSIANQTSGSGRWQCGYCIGALISSWPIDPSYGTLRGSLARNYSNTETQGALYGTDDRVLTIAAGGEAIAEPNFAVDGNGAVHAKELNTLRVLKGETASVGSLVMLPDPDGVTGGLYSSAPTITIGAPPAGGTQATASPATYTLGRIIGFGSTGSGYSLNDILTSVGGTGTQPTFKATGVDANGGVTSCAINTNGSLNAYATTVVIYPTGGTGTGAGFNVVYKNGAPISCAPAVTGKNYVVGNTLGTGGTGTQGVLTVDTVDGFGGILTAHETTLGSLTALPSSPTMVTGGSGSGANLVLGFSIATINMTNNVSSRRRPSCRV
jgi:hypothetical protein